MADQKPANSSASGEKEENKNFLGEYDNVNAYTQQAARMVLQCIRGSHQIPSQGDDYDYYSSFQSFRNLMDMEGGRLCDLMQSILKYHNIKGNLSSTSQAMDIEEKFDVLVDANDQLLEKVSTSLDEAAGLRKTEPNLIVASATPKAPEKLSGSWNTKPSPSTSGPQQKSPRGNMIRLLAAKNLARPQLQFKDPVDNSNTPFMPRIKEKPNALKPLLESLNFDCDPNNVDENFQYPHPYAHELEQLTYTKEQLEKVKPQKPLDLDASPPAVFVDSLYQLENMLQHLKTQHEFAVDLEHHSYRSFQGFTCLLQISTRTKDFIVDTLELRSELHMLNEVFTDSKIVKVLHGADMDIQWLQRDLSLYVVNMFDTGQAARVLSLARFSLAHLLLEYCGVTPNKDFQLADWRIRPLPEELLRYAREDTHYLLYIADVLRNRLLDAAGGHSMLRTVLDRSKQICAQRYEKPRLTDDSHRRLYLSSRKQFSSRQLHALKGLYAWRDKKCRAEDESTGYVLPKHMLMQIAELLPKDSQGIIACCNPVPPLVKQNLNELHAIVKEARQQSLVQVEAPKPKSEPSMAQHPKYQALNVLNCPHDIKPDEKPAGKETANTQTTAANAKPDPTLVAAASSLFSSTVSPVSVKTTPSLTIFQQPKNNKPSKAQEKVKAIKTTIRSPFEKFLPNSAPTALPTSFNAAPEPKWRLLPPTEKPKPKPKKVTVPLAQPKMDDITDSVLTLRHELPQKKKRKEKEERVAEGVANTLNQLRKEHEDLPVKKKMKKDSDEEEEMEEEEEDGDFKPHVYTPEAMRMFKSVKQEQSKKGKGKGKKGKRKEYNPDEEGVHEEIKGAGNKRTHKQSSKSMSYKQGAGGMPKMSWPKRH